MAKIILYSNDTVGKKMAGPGIRYVQMARAFGASHRVLLAAPYPSFFQDEAFQFKAYKRPSHILKSISKADVIIAQKLPPVLLKAVRKNKIKFILDFYDPVVMENLEANRNMKMKDQVAIFNFEHVNQLLQLAHADHILVASERQRDFWLGVLESIGRIIPEVYNEDASLNHLISLLPFGVESKVPEIDDPEAIKKLIPNFTEKDKVILWGGGIWNWFDPLSVIEAVGKLKNFHPEVKLLFLGIRHPNSDMPEMEMTGRAIKLATDMGLVGKSVFFNYEWIPYEERQNYVLPCHIAVSTHFDHAETRLSFRTRIVDSYIWANLPIVATKGDSMGDTIESNNLGLTVDYVDSNQIADAIKLLVEDEKLYNLCQENVKRIRQYFEWKNLVTGVNELIKKGHWTQVTVDNNSLYLLRTNYYRAGFNKIRTIKGWGGIIRKVLHF